jgi:hypothetical protein
VSYYCPTRWLDVFPWAQFMGADGRVWTVLPSYPRFPRRATRAGASVWALPVLPEDVVNLLVPDINDAWLTLRTIFDQTEILTITSPWTMMSAAQQYRHLRDYHAQVLPVTAGGPAGQAALDRLHAGRHQQGCGAVPHFHDERGP